MVTRGGFDYNDEDGGDGGDNKGEGDEGYIMIYIMLAWVMYYVQ